MSLKKTLDIAGRDWKTLVIQQEHLAKGFEMTANRRLQAILDHWGECENYTDGSCREKSSGRVVFSDSGTWNEYCAYCSVEWALEAN